MTRPQPDIRTTLSPEGRRRKEVIRAAACRAAADRRRGARFLTTVAVAALPLVLGVAIWSQLPAGGTLAPETERVFTQGNPDAHGDPIMGDSRMTESVGEDGTPRYRNLRFETIHDWPPVAVNTIDDDELLSLLAEAGRPSGLIRVGERVIVVEQPRVGRATRARDRGGA